MILKTLRDLALREGLLENPDYELKPVAWIIVVGAGGHFIDLVSTAGSGQSWKSRAKSFLVPRRAGRTSSLADFLVDKSEYVLGVEPDGRRSQTALARRTGLFLRTVERAARVTEEVGLAAVWAFLASHDERQRAIERISTKGYKSNDLFAFEFDGQLVHDRPEVQRYFSRIRSSASTTVAQCLVCGATSAPVKKHPSVKVPGGMSAGVALVSFNSDAFESYGLSRNQNAPVCRGCADAYTTALNRLLSDRYPDPRRPGEVLPRRSARLSSDTTAIFWADENTAILDLLADYFNAPRRESVGSLLESARADWAPIDVGNRFYCLILSGGQGRAVVRSAQTGTVAQVERNLKEYLDSIDVGAEQSSPLQFLMRSLVLHGKIENLTTKLVTDVVMSILFGGLFPRTLLASAVERCRAERKVTRERAAILRAYLIRNEKREVSVVLNSNDVNVGYRLGRLMAILARVQRAAHNIYKTIADRYYGAASTRPANVFPRLLAMGRHQVAELACDLRIFYESRLSEVMEGIAIFPSILNMEEQGMFALGYYHQRRDFLKNRRAGPVEDESEKQKGKMHEVREAR